MKKGFLKKIILLTASCVCAFALAGCEIVPSLHLSEEESELVAEYAAGKLIEYVKGHPGGLMILEDVDRSEVNPGLKKEEEEELLPPPLPGEPLQNDAAVPKPESDGEEVPAQPSDGEALVESPVAEAMPTMSIAEAIGADGLNITYGYYEVCSRYPEDDADLAFSMRAATGKNLLVVHFNVANETGEDIEAHTDSENFKVRMLVNGSDKIRGDITFLANDLTNYRGLITPGASIDGVFVFEIEENTEVSSLDLIILGEEGEQQYSLDI